jgi:hypothetical protein
MHPIEFSQEDFEIARFAHTLFPTFFRILEVREGFSKKGPDKHLFRNGELVAYAELEVKRVWKTFEWNTTWATVQFPGRKGHYGTDAYWQRPDIVDCLPKRPTFLVMFNFDGSNGLIVDAETVALSPKVHRPSRRGMDDFYQVPMEKVTFDPKKFEDYILKRINFPQVSS